MLLIANPSQRVHRQNQDGTMPSYCYDVASIRVERDRVIVTPSPVSGWSETELLSRRRQDPDGARQLLSRCRQYPGAARQSYCHGVVEKCSSGYENFEICLCSDTLS